MFIFFVEHHSGLYFMFYVFSHFHLNDIMYLPKVKYIGKENYSIAFDIMNNNIVYSGAGGLAHRIYTHIICTLSKKGRYVPTVGVLFAIFIIRYL